MRPERVVILAPGFDRFLGVVQTDEHMLVKALVAKLAIEALDVAVLDRLPRLNEVQLHAVCIGPGVERFTDELRPVITAQKLSQMKAKGLFCIIRRSVPLDLCSSEICLDRITYILPAQFGFIKSQG